MKTSPEFKVAVRDRFRSIVKHSGKTQRRLSQGMSEEMRSDHTNYNVRQPESRNGMKNIFIA
jgi:hypothetical protein